MDASRYKDYMLGLMFYKFLSDKTLAEYRTSGGYESLKEDELIGQYKKVAEEIGDNLNERSKNIMSLIKIFSDLVMVALQHGDILGDAYENLIGMFAMESGKKAGEFYTRKQVSEVIAQIIAKSSNIKSVYDPTVGSRVIIMTQADSQVNTRIIELLLKFKIRKMDGCCFGL